MSDSAIQFSPFQDSSQYIDKPDALRLQFSEQGYLYLKGLLPGDELLALREEIAAICAAEAWLRADTAPTDLRAYVKPVVEGEDGYFQVYDKIQQLESFHALAHQAPILSLMQQLLGKRCFPHPLAVARLMFPFNTPWSTPPHQDYPNNQGTEDLFACWMPLGDCPIEQGPLAICPGSHKRGLLPLKYALGAGHRQVYDPEQEDFDWVSGPMDVGDVLIFHSLTVHRSLPNQSSQLRLSADFRYQRDGDPLVQQSLEPHFQRTSWDDIYASWQTKKLQYYWRQHDYQLVEWDEAMHGTVGESMAEQVATKRDYERYRNEVSEKLSRNEK